MFLSFNKDTCLICPLAKHARTPFPLSTISSSKCFDLIHCDIWGPFTISSFTGAKYFLAIVDDYSRCTWTYLMHFKYEAFQLIQQFFL